MSKTKLLFDVISNVRALADSIQKVADAMANNDSTETANAPEQTITEKAAKPKKEKAKEYTLEDVRGILAEKSQNGLTTEVKALISKYGGSKLSDIDPSKYEEIIKEAEVLGNG